MNIIICVGPPLSGKSTWAKRFLRDNPSYARFNRDDLRYMLKNKGLVSRVYEEMISSLQWDVINACRFHDYNLIIDSTNVKLKRLLSLHKQLLKYGSVEFKFFEISFRKQRIRNIFRFIKKGIWIPRRVSVSMNNNYKQLIEKLDNDILLK